KFTALLLTGVSCSVWADAVTELQARLSKVEVLSADYSQKVSDPKGKEIQQGSGKIQIKRPNLFRMDNKAPQETQIISDGKTLWFYDPFVEQVTANWVKDAVNDTPFVLLTSDNKSHWNQYSVEQRADTFVLKPKSGKSNIKQFDIRIDADGVLKNFSTIEKDGQANLYLLRNITNQPLADNLFQFTLPKGVELDDQRNKK
ncbi:outer membrane lipoprotein chaperone LolA, partial [Necropsobacter massiliensis]|uniref:outer membrane lipoprotein chaperone LolA n=1 Tax=Necropsobacter massiliensis TaxID=1400001 RepID=UPI000595FFAC